LFLLAFIFVAAFGATAATAEDLNSAKIAEEKAFLAADEAQWCEATYQFLLAHRAAPRVEYIYNAAMAADSSGDRRWATHLFVLILGNYPDDQRSQNISERIQLLTQEIETSGPGESCPNRVADGIGQQQKDALWLVAPPPPVTPKPNLPAEDPNIRWTVVATGGTLALGGATMAFLGGYPYFKGLELYQNVLDDNSSKNRQEYTLIRERWQTLGRPVAIAGAAAFVAGGIVTGLGLNWALQEPPEEE